MDITTIMAGIASGPGKVPGAEPPADGDLAALFAAVLSAAAEAGVVTPATGVSVPATLGGEATGGDPTSADGPASGNLGEGELPTITEMPPELVALLQAATARPAVAEAPSAPGAVGTAAPVDADATALAGPATTPSTRVAPDGATPVGTDASAATAGPDAAVLPAGTDALQGTTEAAVPAAATRDVRPESGATPRDLSSSVPQSAMPGVTTASTDMGGVPADGPATADLRLVERVMEAVELLENAPPPRRIRLEVGDLRLAVSLRADGVHVAIDGDAAPTRTWQSDLSTALEARGMSLADGGARDGGDRREPPDPEETPAPPTPRPGRRAPDDADRGLRI